MNKKEPAVHVLWSDKMKHAWLSCEGIATHDNDYIPATWHVNAPHRKKLNNAVFLCWVHIK